MNDARSQKTSRVKRRGADNAARQCPICAAHVTASSASYPFCSKRCRLVDLGQWFSGSYAISREIEDDDEV